MFHYIPVHPINSELNYLWMLPMVFVMFCFTQVVFLEHLMGEDLDEDGNAELREVVDGGMLVSSEPLKPENPPQTKTNKLQFTNSVHLLNLGHTAIIVLVMLHFAKELHYAWYGGLTFTETGGKLDRHVNFELTELLKTASYDKVSESAGKFLASS